MGLPYIASCFLRVNSKFEALPSNEETARMAAPLGAHIRDNASDDIPRKIIRSQCGII